MDEGSLAIHTGVPLAMLARPSMSAVSRRRRCSPGPEACRRGRRRRRSRQDGHSLLGGGPWWLVGWGLGLSVCCVIVFNQEEEKTKKNERKRCDRKRDRLRGAKASTRKPGWTGRRDERTNKRTTAQRVLGNIGEVGKTINQSYSSTPEPPTTTTRQVRPEKEEKKARYVLLKVFR